MGELAVCYGKKHGHIVRWFSHNKWWFSIICKRLLEGIPRFWVILQVVRNWMELGFWFAVYQVAHDFSFSHRAKSIGKSLGIYVILLNGPVKNFQALSRSRYTFLGYGDLYNHLPMVDVLTYPATTCFQGYTQITEQFLISTHEWDKRADPSHLYN